MKENPGQIDIHRRDKRLSSAKNLILNSKKCSKENKDLILKYIDDRVTEDNISLLRQSKSMVQLRILAEYMGEKSFEEATADDLKGVMKQIYESDLSDATKYDYGVILKTFFKWLRKSDKPEETAWIKRKQPRPQKLRTEDKILWEDVMQLSNAATNPRDKAIVQVLWDAGCRVEELLTLQIRDAEVMNGGSSIVLHFRKSKTEQGIRDTGIALSAPTLVNWIDNHPIKDNPEAPLFIKLNKFGPMNYGTIRKALQDLKERSGLKKDIKTKQFRKSSASYYAHYLSGPEAKLRYGWTQSSRMLDVYLHPSQELVNEKVLSISGVKEAPKSENEIKERPVRCIWCKRMNPAGQKFCTLCKRPLDTDPGTMQIYSAITEISNEFLETKKEEFEQYAREKLRR